LNVGKAITTAPPGMSIKIAAHKRATFKLIIFE